MELKEMHWMNGRSALYYAEASKSTDAIAVLK